MPEELYLDQDSLKVSIPEDNNLVTLFWGDSIHVVERNADHLIVELDSRMKGEWVTRQASIPVKTKLRRDPVVLKVRFIDVGQGDAIFETPQGRLVVIDGGEHTNLVRYASVLLHGLRKKKGDPVLFDAVIVTHRDADHFAGLTTMLGSRGKSGKPRFVPRAVFHNGLVKRPDKKQPEQEMFGKTVPEGDFLYCTELVDDLVACDPEAMNRPFREWREVLERLRDPEMPFPIERLWFGRDDAFDFLAEEGEKLRINVLGPVVDTIGGKPALRFLKKPGSKTSLSASHTINGHSIVLKLTFGNVRFLFGADLNKESETRLLEKVKGNGLSLEAEILKVPHHGSHEFIPKVLAAISPVVSIISSGDENPAKEYIHPRSGLVGALGKYSRSSVEKPLIFATEMVAFFAEDKELYRKREPEEIGAGMKPYALVPDAYVKSQFGIVHIRTDGRRVLVFTHSGRRDLKEKYAFTVAEDGKIDFED